MSQTISGGTRPGVTESDLIQTEITKIESSFITDPENVAKLCRVSELYLQLGKTKNCERSIEKAMRIFRNNKEDVNDELGGNLVDIAINCWKSNKYAKKNTIRLNLLREQSVFLSNIHLTLNEIVKKWQISYKQSLSFKLAYVKEQMGLYEEALAILSDLITAQAMEASVDLTFIIFKASLLLKHIGGNTSQCIEYIDFLVDDPPVNEGYFKSHILAFQTLVFEQCGNEYEVLLERSYKQLLETYNSEMSTGKKPITNQKKIDSIVSKKGFDKSSEIWEVFGLQALERSEYVLAAEFLKEAVSKAPNKGKLNHILAEIYYVLNELPQSMIYAEKAYTLQPGSPELRNLLLTLSPDKWTERLRIVAPTRELNHRDIETDNVQIDYDNDETTTSKPKTANTSSTSDAGWLAVMRGKANETIRAVQEDGAAGLLTSIGFSKTPEQRAQDAANRERRRREKHARREKKIKAQEEREAAAAVSDDKAKSARNAGTTSNGHLRPKPPARVGPARPVKPIYSEQTDIIIKNILTGNSNEHLYDANLRILSEIRDAVEREERERLEKRNREKILSKKTAKS